MRRLYISGIILFFFVRIGQVHAQVAIGTSGSTPTPDPSAVLLLVGDGKQGLILPTINTISTAPGKAGMVAYSAGKVYYHDGTIWTAVGGGAGGSTGLRLQGNVLSLDPTGTSSIGLANPTVTSSDVGRLFVWDGTQWTTTPKPTTVGQVLQWNGTTWVLSTISGGSGTVTNVTGTSPITVTNNTTTPSITLNPLTDTNISATANISGTKLQDGTMPVAKLAAGSATNGQVLTFNSGSWAPANLGGGGTITGVTAGTGLSGGGVTGTVTLNIANTAVTPGSYGNATNIPQVTVDAQGRITSASNVPLSVALPTLGGDISGASVSATTVTGIQGRAVSATAPTTNQVLQFNGTSWVPATVGGGGTVTNVTGTGPISVANGTTTPAISLNLTAADIPSLDATKITSGILPVSVGGTGRTTWNGLLIGAGSTINDISNGSNGQVLTIAGGNPTWQNISPTGAAGGSLAGSYPNPTIAAGVITTTELAANSVATVDIANLAVTDAKINDVAPGKITQAGASSGQVLKWNGTAWAPAADAVGGGGAPTLNPGQIIVGDGSTNSAATIGQDASLNSTNGNITVQGLRGRPIATTAPTTNSVYQFDGTQWAPVVLSGGGTVSNIATGTGLTGGPITATGTISVAAGGIGTTELANISVTTGKLAANAVTTSQILDGTIADADISGTAAIAVTKLATGTNGQVLTVSGGVPTWQTSAALTNPMTAPNDLIIGGAGGVATRLAAPGNSQLLTTNGTGAVTWVPQTNFIAGGSQAANLVLASPNGSAGTPTFRSIVNGDITSVDAGKITTGTLPIARGGTNSVAAPTNGAVAYGTGTAFAFTAAGTSGQLLQSNGAAAPTWVNAPAAGWSLTGNAGTNPATNFVGTTDAQPLRFGTGIGGVERMRITAAGNVGIGSTSPLTKLDIAGGNWDLSASEGDLRIGDASTYRLKMGISTGGGGAGDAYIAAQGGTNRLFLGTANTFANTQTLTLAGGNVGIGTNSPSYLLDASKSLASATDAQIRLVNPNTAASTKTGIRLENSGGWAVHLQTSNGDNWLELTNNAGTPYHRWTFDSYFPNSGTPGFVQGTGSGLTLGGGNVDIDGFTNLGSGAPQIKMAYFTGTTAATQGGIVNFSMGTITSAKIISATVLVDWTGNGDWISPRYNGNPGYDFTWYTFGSSIYVTVNTTANGGQGSANILSKQIRAVVTYIP